MVPWRGAPRRTARCRRTLLLLLAVASSARRRWPDARLPTQPLQAKAIQRLIEALCSELRGVAVPLVDSFAIPDHILRAPIGLRWGWCWAAFGVGVRRGSHVGAAAPCSNAFLCRKTRGWL